jgi:hypothetical protein
MAIELPEQPRSAAECAGEAAPSSVDARTHRLPVGRAFCSRGVDVEGDVQGLLEDEYGTADEGRSSRIFIGLRCELCGVRAITSVVDGVRICSSCAHVS